ncbi:MAG: DUF4363 family protein [Oscillospiraceae bacterium]|nr:DUF4363 family protein [Oscillospiraceae bacterium]
MKRLFIIVQILTLILFVAVSGVVYARNTCEELVSMTEEAKRLSDAEDAAALALQAEKMSAFLEGRHLILSLYVRHDELEKLTVHLLTLCAQSKAGSTDVQTTLAQVSFMAQHIYERELPNLDNLL